PGPDSDDADNTKPDSPITDAAATHSPEHECRCSIKSLFSEMQGAAPTIWFESSNAVPACGGMP
ncbi:hypothetical protein, partial [Nocardia seriolae]|uniref:hypothetical protein n=1 Tax=Nocardia seriolae TaxID=37332 RepID=UPI001C632D7E